MSSFEDEVKDKIELAFWNWNENGREQDDAIGIAVTAITAAHERDMEAKYQEGLRNGKFLGVNKQKIKDRIEMERGPAACPHLRGRHD